MPVKSIPEGCQVLTPYLYIRDAAGALDFYKKAFGATERMRMADPGGRVMHAEILIGDSAIMLADEFPEIGVRSPKSYGGSPMCLHLYVEDVDAQVSRAVEAGATVVRPVEDKFYGDRTGMIEDPFGHLWSFATHVEDVTPEQMQERFEGAMKSQA
jgi:PhnB protein